MGNNVLIQNAKCHVLQHFHMASSVKPNIPRLDVVFACTCRNHTKGLFTKATRVGQRSKHSIFFASACVPIPGERLYNFKVVVGDGFVSVSTGIGDIATWSLCAHVPGTDRSGCFVGRKLFLGGVVVKRCLVCPLFLTSMSIVDCHAIRILRE